MPTLHVPLLTVIAALCLAATEADAQRNEPVALHPHELVGGWSRRVPARALTSPAEPYRIFSLELLAGGEGVLLITDYPNGEATSDEIAARNVRRNSGRWRVLSELNEGFRLCVSWQSEAEECWSYTTEVRRRGNSDWTVLILVVPGRGQEEWARRRPTR